MTTWWACTTALWAAPDEPSFGPEACHELPPPVHPPLPPPPEPADWGHRYRAGAKVQVLRTDGVTYSPGTVLGSYEGVFDVLYQVQLADSGLIKQAVPEGEMFSSEDADDENFKAHFQQAMQAMMDAMALDSMFGMECDYD